MRAFQKGFNFSQDGPGNRLVYHLQGCNMKCIWCSNPEGMSLEGGFEVTVADIVEEALSCIMMFFDGGGVTFTGGEATLQFEELHEVLKKLRAHHIHTAIESNGTNPKLKELLGDLDYLIMDFKHYDSEILKQYTGIGAEHIKSNFEYICANHHQAHIRIPLINHINTQNPTQFAEYFSQFDTSQVVFEFLPYHEYGKEKWLEAYQVKDGFITNETLQKFHEVFKSYQLKTLTT